MEKNIHTFIIMLPRFPFLGIKFGVVHILLFLFPPSIFAPLLLTSSPSFFGRTSTFNKADVKLRYVTFTVARMIFSYSHLLVYSSIFPTQNEGNVCARLRLQSKRSSSSSCPVDNDVCMCVCDSKFACTPKKLEKKFS